MSKIIKISDELKTEVLEAFIKYLDTNKMADGKISFTKDFSKIDKKCTVQFSELAWYKMQSLVRECDKEIAWQGTAFRLEGDVYKIEDIFVYPQIVTGVTVTTDDAEQNAWFDSLEDDVINNLRFQGHSHVNIGVSPSPTDNNLYDNILNMIGENDFYIFAIYNKKGDRFFKVYDLEKNVLFENADVTVEITGDMFGLDEFTRESLAKLKSPASPTYNYGTTSYYNNYSCNQTTAATKPSTPAEPKETPANGKKKGKMKDVSYSYSYYDDWYDDEIEYWGKKKGGYYYD